MEYEKHVNSLVLGFLKTNCKSAYKVFLKSHHTSPQKHMSHWVAGQTLEVILKNYSRIQNIVHGCLEDTDYCKEKGVEACSPYYLPEQLLYLLERDRPASPTSTIATARERSPDPPNYECEDDHLSNHPSEVEATPTHLLPGNISSIMTKKLLQKTDFHEKLAHNINAAFSVPEPTSGSEKCAHDNELENSIKKALTRTEADPAFHDLLEDLLGPVSSQPEKPGFSNSRQEQEPVLTGNGPSQIAEQPQDSASLQPNGLYAFPSQTVARPGNPQQQFYIVNQPILIPQPNPQTMLQQLQSATQALSVDTGQNIRAKTADEFSEQDIMSMPTIFINDRNELTYADSRREPSRGTNPVETSTPSMSAEVSNAKEYINAFGMGGPSPIVKKAAPPKAPPQKPPKARPRKPVPIQPVPSLLIQIVPQNPPQELPNIMSVPPVAEPTSTTDLPKQPRSLGSICTPSPIVPETKKPTPISGSHVRSLQFPSPIRKTSGAEEPPAPEKQQAAKDLFNNDSDTKPLKSKKLTSPCRKKKWAWDAGLRSNIVIPKSPPPVKRVRKRNRPVNLDVSDSAGMKLEEALRSPPKPDQPKPKKKETAVDVKTVVSPSTLCNTANKRNMEVDGPAKLSARKNINSLLETPMKKDKIVDLAATPLTPMLKANLQGIIGGDTFTIATPDFPITPGMSLMENSSAAYCMLKESETNKATEAGVLEEEKKSSVRKVDDEDIPPSPKVYGGIDTLEAFNRNQTGKKNLELLDKDGVQWEAKSDGSEEESNRTVIRNPTATQRVTRSAMITRSATGKSMAALKCQLLQKDRQMDAQVEEPASPDSKKAVHAEGPEENSVVSDKVEKQPSKAKKESRGRKETEKLGKKKEVSSGSGKTKKDKVAHKRQSGSKDRASMASKSPQAAEDPATSRSDAKSSKKRQSDASNPAEVTDAKDLQREQDEINNGPHSSNTPEGILNGPLYNSNFAKSTCEFSLRAEIEEKRQRVIKLVKAESALMSKTPTRRKSIKPKPNLAAPRNKRKGAAPKKLLAHEDDDVDSQDEFFKKIGSNLHRTNKQAEAGNGRMSSETGPEEPTELKNGGLVSDKCQKPEADPKTHDSVDSSQYYWESCVFVAQPEEQVLVFDDKAPSGRSLEDYNWNLDNKGFVVSIPLEDEREQSVKLTITPARILWEIPPSEIFPEDSSDPEDSRNFKKRKMRSDSCNSNGSTKKIKTSLHPSFLNEQNIEKVLTRLHGPSDKT